MDTVLFNGNGATHYNINNNFDLNKATHTSWIAMEKFVNGLVDLNLYTSRI